MCQLTILRLVFGQVGIQEHDRLATSHGTVEDEQPRSDPDGTTLERHGDLRAELSRMACRVPGSRSLELPTRSIERLLEIAGAADQADRDEW
jgi:hypothetical protein